MAMIGAIGEFQSEKEDFPSYVERLEQFFLINKTVETDKVALFITLLGPTTYSVLKKLLVPNLPKSKSFNDLIKVLTNHFAPKRLVIAERFHFNKRNQLQDEDVSAYIVELKNLAQTCDFAQFLDDALRDRLVCGISSEAIRCRLLLESELNFEKACLIAQSMEIADNKSRLFQSTQPTSSVYKADKVKGGQVGIGKMQYEKGPATTRTPKQNRQCWRCGRSHDATKCPAQHWECFTCRKKGHTSKMCRKKKVSLVEEDSDQSDLDVVDRIGHLTVKKTTGAAGRPSVRSYLKKINEPLEAVVQVGGQRLKMEVDTGAGVSLMSTETYNKLFSHVGLEKCSIKLTTASGSRMSVIGKIHLNVVGETGISHRLPIIVAKVSKCTFFPLLGRSWLDVLTPNWRKTWSVKRVGSQMEESVIYGVSSFVNTQDRILSQFRLKYPNVFKEDRSESIRGFVANLVLKEGATPIFHRAYSVPYSLLDRVKKELKELEESQTIVPVKYSEWASPLVIVPKKDGGIRVCVDFKVTLNQALKVDHYPLPRLEDVFASLAGCQVFSILDLSNAYQQLVVGEDTRDLLTVNTHLGLFRFTRLPYGVASAPAIFQSIMDQILRGLPMTTCYLDDVLIGGRSQAECEAHLEKVLERLNEFNVRVNIAKCKFFCKSVDYLGHTIDSIGVHPLKSKMEAISEAPEPKNLSQLKSYLGLLNFYNRFLPMLSSKLRPLHRLEEKGVEWNWTGECSKAFQLSKKMLLENGALVHYDPKKPLVVTCDASQYGVGAVLSHIIENEERPVLFASSTLSRAERNYSQLEREALSIIFAVKRFHRYLYGQLFTLVTDHQPLKSIFGPKKGVPTLAASRLQRWAIILSAYSYDIRYKKGSDIQHADMLSRLPLPEILNESAGILSITSELPLTHREIAEGTKRDRLLSRVLDLTRNGWPNFIADPNFGPFFTRRNELSVEGECVTWGNRIIIPAALREAVLDILHDQHPGIVRMKMLARSEVWWPGIDHDVEEKVRLCGVCQMTQPNARQVPLCVWPRAERIWQRLHIDFLEKDGVMFLICIDSTSKWIEVWIMKGTSATKTIVKLRSSFAMFGFPVEIVSDNGPPFSSGEFAQFCRANGIKLSKSPPYHPSSNGLAERGVQTLKRNLRKQVVEASRENESMPLQQRLDNFLFAYRNTPSTVTGVSPAEFIFRQKPRTRLSMLKPTFAQSEKQSQKAEKMAEYQNSMRGRMRTFCAGDMVWVSSVKSAGVNWLPGRVLQVLSRVTYLVEVKGRERMVHGDQLRKFHVKDSGHLGEDVLDWPKDSRDLSGQARTESAEGPSQDTPNESRLSQETPSGSSTLDSGTSEENLPKDSVESTGKEVVLRRSSRKVRPPARLDSDSWEI